MNKLLLLSLLLVLNFKTFSQKITPFQSWSGEDLARANSARTLKDISFQEKKVIFFINLARMNGKLFAETYLKDYMDDVRIPKNKYYKSLIKTLNEQDTLPIIEPQEDLFNEAIKHAKEMGRSGKKGHRSEDAKGFEERVKHISDKYEKLKEINQYGYPDALSIVVDLLIDDTIESLIHRRTILNKDLKYVGVGIRAHKKYMINTSLLFSGELAN